MYIFHKNKITLVLAQKQLSIKMISLGLHKRLKTFSLSVKKFFYAISSAL